MSRKRRELKLKRDFLGTAEIQREFIDANWDQLAAMAWHGYQQKGRGFIGLDLNIFYQQAPHSAALGAHTSGRRFFEFISTERFLDGSPELTKAIAEYDPERSVIFCFRWQPGDGRERNHVHETTREPFPKDTVWLGKFGNVHIPVPADPTPG
jgi:hypothetical protein